MNKQAKLVSISRGFGGDNAEYELIEENGDTRKAVVSVGWALGHRHITVIVCNGDELAKFSETDYIQPHAALVKLGYEVHGLVDFSGYAFPRIGDN